MSLLIAFYDESCIKSRNINTIIYDHIENPTDELVQEIEDFGDVSYHLFDNVDEALNHYSLPKYNIYRSRLSRAAIDVIETYYI